MSKNVQFVINENGIERTVDTVREVVESLGITTKVTKKMIEAGEVENVRILYPFGSVELGDNTVALHDPLHRYEDSTPADQEYAPGTTEEVVNDAAITEENNDEPVHCVDCGKEITDNDDLRISTEDEPLCVDCAETRENTVEDTTEENIEEEDNQEEDNTPEDTTPPSNSKPSMQELLARMRELNAKKNAGKDTGKKGKSKKVKIDVEKDGYPEVGRFSDEKALKSFIKDLSDDQLRDWIDLEGLEYKSCEHEGINRMRMAMAIKDLHFPKQSVSSKKKSKYADLATEDLLQLALDNDIEVPEGKGDIRILRMYTIMALRKAGLIE